MKTLSPSRWPEVLEPFRIRSHGRIQVRSCTQGFGFQIRARDLVPHPTLLFGMAQVEALVQPARFVVRIDLEAGEVWDAANDCGLLGTVARANWPSRDESHPLALRWTLERTGSALLPRLHLGDEEILYPAQLFPGQGAFVAFSGHDLEGVNPRAVFSPGYVWCQDRLP